MERRNIILSKMVLQSSFRVTFSFLKHYGLFSNILFVMTFNIRIIQLTPHCHKEIMKIHS